VSPGAVTPSLVTPLSLASFHVYPWCDRSDQSGNVEGKCPDTTQIAATHHGINPSGKVRFLSKRTHKRLSCDEWSQRSRPNFTFFDPVKIRGGVGENAEQDDRVETMAEPVIHI